MGEAAAPVHAGHLGDHVRADALLDHLVELVLVELADRLEHLDPELAAHHGGGGEQLAGALGQRRQAAADHLADALGQLERPRRAVALRVGRGGAEVAHHLLEEERVALGLLPQRAVDVLGHALRPELADQDGGVLLVEPGQLDPVEVVLAAQLHEHVDQRRRALGVADRGHDQQRRLAGRADHLAQHQQRRLVGPVQVVEHEHDRLVARDVVEHLGDGVEEPVALLLLGAAGRVAGARQLGDHAAELGAVLGAPGAGLLGRARRRSGAAPPRTAGRARASRRRSGRTARARPRPRRPP